MNVCLNDFFLQETSGSFRPLGFFRRFIPALAAVAAGQHSVHPKKK